MEHNTIKYLITKDFQGVTYYWCGYGDHESHGSWSDDIFNAQMFSTEDKARKERNRIAIGNSTMTYAEIWPYEMILRLA